MINEKAQNEPNAWNFAAILISHNYVPYMYAHRPMNVLFDTVSVRWITYALRWRHSSDQSSDLFADWPHFASMDIFNQSLIAL